MFSNGTDAVKKLALFIILAPGWPFLGSCVVCYFAALRASFPRQQFILTKSIEQQVHNRECLN